MNADRLSLALSMLKLRGIEKGNLPPPYRGGNDHDNSGLPNAALIRALVAAPGLSIRMAAAIKR